MRCVIGPTSAAITQPVLRTSSQNVVPLNFDFVTYRPPRAMQLLKPDRPELWNRGIAMKRPSPGSRPSSGTQDHIWNTPAHGTTAAFEGPVVPDVSSNVLIVWYSGPGNPIAGSTSAKNSWWPTTLHPNAPAGALPLTTITRASFGRSPHTAASAST